MQGTRKGYLLPAGRRDHLMPPRPEPGSEPGPRVQRFIAEARGLTRAAECRVCKKKSLEFDYAYVREPYSLRFFEHCSECNHRDEF